MWAGLRAFVTTYGLLAIPVALALWVAWGFVAPPPPRTLVMAVGQPGGAYWAAAERYREALAREEITLTLRETGGAAENLSLLQRGEADLAFVQGGALPPEPPPGIVTIGGVFHEAVWLFRRAGLALARIGDLRGARIAAGPEGSGTRALAVTLLAASGIGPGEAELLALSGAAAAAALEAGEVDAALFVSARASPAIERLLRAEAVALVDFADRSDAYVAAFPFLSAVRLGAGTVSLSDDLPGQAAVLLAPTAQVAVRDDIHAQIVALMMGVLAGTHRGRDLFAPPGRFPNGLLVDLPLHPDAARWYRDGPSFLQRVAPFWVAVWLERMWVLVIPLLAVALPLLRIAPPLWRWQVERRVYRWYGRLRALEAELAGDGADRARIARDLAALDARLLRLRVPLAYAQQLYHLRAHLERVQARVTQT